MKLRLSIRAQTNLATIADHLMLVRPRGAAHVRRQIEATLQLIVEYPLAGRDVSGGRRRFVVRRYPYVIIYRVDDVAEMVTVLTIRHTARQPEA